jgi:2-oxoglutarate ferredoxin oxidoreductase subunit beta
VVALGHKFANPDSVVISYQGDGDLASIGLAETIATAQLGAPITVIFINNAIYGMTGGQMAPTTMPGQKTSTSPYGRDIKNDGAPFKMAELLSQLEGVAFSARVAVNNPKNVLQAKKMINTAFRYQVEKRGFSFIEALAACPTNWGMQPLEANKRVGDEMIPYFPLGVYRNTANL